jgi:hypothetical protein
MKAAVYTPLVPLLNFFMPTQKLKSKTRVGSKETRVYDEPKNSSHRLMENGNCPGSTRMPWLPNVPFTTRRNCNRISTRLSCICTSGFQAQEWD